ncbi:MAG: hypothetical protein GY878_13355 [Fuerstiella sp.]|nr:hypothetical protein [Fuerstiella sp.]
MREFWAWLRLVFRTLWKSPLLLVTLLVAVVATNVRILLNRRGRKVWVLSVEDATYLPFVQGALAQMPDGFFDEIMLVVACRKFAIAEVTSELMSSGIPVSLAIENWSCGMIVFYDLFVSTHQSAVVPVVRRGPRVCLFHGLPAKGGTFVSEQWRFFDGAFLIGPLQERMFEDFRSSSRRSAELWGRRIGLIKSDALLNGKIDRTEVICSLGIDADQPTVLYAPSWESGASLRSNGTGICERLAEQPWNTIVKLHPMSYFPSTEVKASGGVDWIERLASFESDRFRHASRADITPLLAAADVLVTDVSSVAFEAILIDMPVVFLDCPEFFRQTVGEMYGLSEREARDSLEFNCGRDAGAVVTSPDELVTAINFALADPTAQAAEREQVRAELVFNPGRAATVAAEALVELLEASQGRSPESPDTQPTHHPDGRDSE